MAEALISVLLEQLASIIKKQVEQEFRLVVDVKKEVEKLTRNFQAIHVVLENAEERQMKEVDVRYWLDSLKDLSYEMDDVLDEWSTEILKQHIQKQEKQAGNAGSTSTTKKVCFCIPAPWFCFCHQVVLRLHIAMKIKELNERLDQIASERHIYKFRPTKRGIEQIEREKSSSFVDQTFGREVEKDTLVKRLLSESGQARPNFLVIPIVGMGGIGKTTLAQLAYNDERVQAHFDNRIWVCVSDPFDEIKIAKAIIEGLKKETPASNELHTLKSIIDESVKGKKFLLVLDDVWNQDYSKWKQLMLPLQNGAVGSRILVTTRKEEVARMVVGASTDIVNLEVLSEEKCWALFYHIALADREKNESKVLEFTGKEIVKKCKGLPLVAKTLGGLMRYKETRKEWEDVLNSKIWELDVVEEQVFQSLLLSYYDLAPAIKRCLLYCVIFPKDYNVVKDNLIELWMSQNYLDSIGNKEKEVVGEMYFDNLVKHSFFQEFEKDELGNITGCKMHDVVHDFLQFLTKNECLVLEAEGGNNKRIMEFDGYKKVRHLTLRFAPEGPLIPSSLCNCKNLRTLTTFDSKITSFVRKLISQVKCLRTLNLSFNSIKEVPNEVGELAHLRYFDLSYNEDLMKLPDSLCNLMNLQTLRLIWCRALERLPEGMGKLINLRHLYVMGCLRLKLPKGIARLTSLRTLDQVRILDVDNKKEALFELSDLRNLDQLRGSFRIEFPEDQKDARQAEEAHLVNKNCLVSLELRFSYGGTDEIPLKACQEETLNALQPPPNLESFSIYHYSGTTLQRHWMTSLNKLRSLYLGFFNSVEFLPPLGRLESLEVLEIQDWPSLKKVGVEFLGIDGLMFNSSSSSSSSSSRIILFPNLKTLVFYYLPEWEEWEGMTGWSEEEDSQKTITIMPCLSSLRIGYCGLLKTLPNFLRNTPLKELVMGFDCRILAQGCRKGRGGREWPKISHIPNIQVWIGRSSEFVQKDGVWIGQQQTDDDES
ncbi:putative disease resistance protein RGA3 [Prunus avium]|uniref:Disease resistance protein RGA3 n=1 Tax=Prunus avium TaxID=42229 RepID=A0A6P5TH28_PRUAV|nr:putative disease resistance protein RGA3 [Prunus avium]